MADKQKDIYRFVILVALGYFGFQFADVFFQYLDFTRPAWLYLYHITLQVVIFPSLWILKTFGFDAYKSYDILWIVGTKGVRIDNVCLGLDLIVNLIVLIVAYPGNLRLKFLIIPIGILLILLLNIVRATGIVISQYYHASWFKFDYHYTYNILVYLISFGAWMVYVNLSDKKAKMT